MCFSATASFVSGGVLLSVGAVAIRKLQFFKKEFYLTIIPIIFGIHQLSEGVVWLGLNSVAPSVLEHAAMYFYVFIAMCFWPVFIPLAMLKYEYPKKRNLFIFFLASGFMISAYLLWCFSVYSDLYIDVQCCHSIAYVFELPYLDGIIDYFYLAVVVFPCLCSSNLRLRYIFGPVLLATFCIALALESEGDYPSIWCFLAAVISICIYYSLYSQTKVESKLKGRKMIETIIETTMG